MVRVGPGQRCANVLLPEFAEVTDLCFPRGHSSGRDPARGGRELIRYVDLSEIHEDILADHVLSVVIREEWGAI